MDRIYKFLHCVYMGIAEASQTMPSEMTDLKSWIISTQRSYRSRRQCDGVRSMCMCVIDRAYMYVCMEEIDALNWVQQGIYLVQFRTLFLAN